MVNMKKIILCLVVLSLIIVDLVLGFSINKAVAATGWTQLAIFKIANLTPPLTQAEIDILGKFDIAVMRRDMYDDVNGATWAAMRAINPDIDIYNYTTGKSTQDDDAHKSALRLNNVARYDIDHAVNGPPHSMGDLNNDNTDLFLLDKFGNRVTNAAFSSNYFMDFGTTKWVDYWVEANNTDVFTQLWSSGGLYGDVLSALMAQQSTTPVKYNGVYEWIDAMNDFCNRATAALHAKGQRFCANRGHSTKADGVEAWIRLDAMSTPPDVFLEEGYVAVSFGSGDVQFYPESSWLNQVGVMRNIHNSNVIYQASTDILPGETGIDNWGKAFNYYDVLWYALASYQIGKNTADDTSFFSMKTGSFADSVPWYDEYDDIDLGDAVGLYKIDSSHSANIYYREFVKGYVYVNPTTSNVSGINLPESCRQINRNNMASDPETLPIITTMSLNSHRGTFLWKADFDPGPGPGPIPPDPEPIPGRNVQTISPQGEPYTLGNVPVRY